jgi:hypothetical protein
MQAMLRNRSLDQIERRDPGFGCEGKVGAFVSAYLRAEVFATRIITFYRADRGLKGKGLQVDVLVAATRHFGMGVDPANIRALFLGGEGKRGAKTARQLRNGYLHTLSAEDRKEILTSSGILTSQLTAFIRNRINAM